MLFIPTNLRLPLLTYFTLCTSLAFPGGGDKDHKPHKTCSALLSTKTKTTETKVQSYFTKTELSPYPSPSTSYILTTTAHPYTTTVYNPTASHPCPPNKSKTKTYTTTYTSAEKVPITTYIYSTKSGVKTYTQVESGAQTSVGTRYEGVTGTWTVVTVTATKTNRQVVTRETKVPVTRMEVETRTVCGKE